MSERPTLGAHVEGTGTRFSCYTEARECAVRLLGSAKNEVARHVLTPLGDGYFEACIEGAGPGSLYDFCVDGRCLPDPYARYLPFGVHGPAIVCAARTPKRLPRQRPLAGQVIYELHVGTFTEAGTFASAMQRLPELVELGVTSVELMPIAAFAGSRGWGYDGVALFAPHAAYGTPDDLAALVERAHELGLSMLLDVVYNHFGPSGNYLGAYARSYFREDIHNAWGQAPNFEHPALRALVLGNARYWLTEFGFDGLRLDATHAIIDPSPRHLLSELAELAHSLSPARLLIAEDERNQAGLVSDIGLDALWADDFHHQLRVLLTRERDGYYAAFEPRLDDLARTINQGWLYSGQNNPLSRAPRGTPADALRAEQLVYCVQNHDQVGNRALGDRLASSISPRAYRSASLLLLFLPMTPLLFMGQEWGAQTPFLYFTDHEAELGKLVSEGRRREFAAFEHFKNEAARSEIPDPQAEATFLRSRLDRTERAGNEAQRTLELYRQALAMRREDPVLTNTGRSELAANVDGQLLVVERWLGSERRVLLVNFGERDVRWRELAGRRGFGSPRCLLQSEARPHDDVVSPEGAVLLAVHGA
ncbi:MAG: malto-oligosyltrehalose trehalohydrolase [Myxococcota bacterium]